ncbi:FAD binding domain-containing protein [Crucibulum laeve]|uniref:FAD binding domain-containing protein n=1 Tax=Crucibulum laeve TaxID=68775 RepID=A0A5C3M511_9AGAR|nr:FAD binding domain-containing protein [Crucibulum laeve]
MPTSLLKESNVDVLIIGAGPAGVMACNALAKAGINVKIVDQRPEKVAAGQADGVQPRTMEVLQSYGLAERFLKEANQLHMVAFYNPSQEGGIELADRITDVTSATRYPFEATLHQGAIESLFLDSMKSMGIEVSRPFTPASIQVSENEEELKDTSGFPVRVVLRSLAPSEGQADTEIVNAKFVIGADGAHSWVRKAFNITMEGEQSDYIWGVVDFTPDTDFPDIRNRCAIHSDNGSCMIIPREGDKVRLYIQLGDNSAVDATSGRVDKTKIGPHQLLEVARKSLFPYTIKTPETFEWWTIYIIGQRVASQYSIRDRIFIAGDACHTHSPKAGQGMNASMNDTHNLAWKLALVVRGLADMSLLQTYEFERRKYAQDLIAFDRQFAKLFSGKPRTELNQDGVSHEEFLKAFQTFGGFTSGVGIHYAESPITNSTHQAFAKDLIIGKRLPPQALIRAADARPVEIQDYLPSDCRFKILIFAGNTSSTEQQTKIEKLADSMSSILTLYVHSGNISDIFDIISISSATKKDVRYNSLPALFRSHWSKVLLDDIDVQGKQGGDAYKNFGVDSSGVVVIVRPDGYVGTVAPFDSVKDIKAYFSSFMKVQA